jgi:putative zinc finger/helix-turn-helix YgiT family protein
MKRIKTDYKYTESGLQNVILEGITAYKCSKCRGIYPIISKIKEVHKAIAQQLLKKDSLLTGKEMVYLRKEMKIKAKDLAEILGVTKVTVSRWENEKEQISPICDRLIRVLYGNRIFIQTCELVRPGIDKLESPIMKSILGSLCEPKTSIENVFRNIRRCQVHSKIAIPISNLNFLTGALDSDLSIEFMEKMVSVQTKHVSSQSVTLADFTLEDVCRAALEIVTTVRPTGGIGTTVDDALTLPLTPPISIPNKGGLASA